MIYDKLKEEIKEIGKISATVPEAFRDKCFEVLLNHLLSGLTEVTPPKAPPKTNTNETPPVKPGNIAFPSHVKALMRKKDVTQEQIEALVMIEGDEFHFIKEPEHGQAAKGQIDWALLLALKNGIQNNTIKVDPEDVRSMVQEKGFYDSANFAGTFKKAKYASLFRGVLERQGEAQALSTEGETALASLIKELSGV